MPLPGFRGALLLRRPERQGLLLRNEVLNVVAQHREEEDSGYMNVS